MPGPRRILVIAVGCILLMSGVWVLRHRSPDDPAAPTASVSGRRTNATEATRAGVSAELVFDQTGQRYWRDPSLDPATLARAFAPPPAPSHLPPEARPKAPAIHPPAREWQARRRADSAVAY